MFLIYIFFSFFFQLICISSVGGEVVVIFLTMGVSLTLFLVLVSLPAILAQEIRFAKIVVDGTTAIAETDDNYICATIDWWPNETCRYGYCTWQNSSVITMVRI